MIQNLIKNLTKNLIQNLIQNLSQNLIYHLEGFFRFDCRTFETPKVIFYRTQLLFLTNFQTVLKDQRAGLQWISMFAGVFGGDHNSVCLDGCSAGSQSGWHHITGADSWPYFHRAVTNGIGLPAGIYYEDSGKPKVFFISLL